MELNDKVRQYRLDKKAENYVISNLMEIMNIGVREGALSIKYPQDMMLMVLYGISAIMKNCVMEENKLFTMEMCIRDSTWTVYSTLISTRTRTYSRGKH